MTIASTDPRTAVRSCLDAAADEEPIRLQPTDRFLRRATDLIAGRAPEPADPAVRAARSLATVQQDYRDLLGDAAYESLLPAFAALAKALPAPLERAGHLTVVPEGRS